MRKTGCTCRRQWHMETIKSTRNMPPARSPTPAPQNAILQGEVYRGESRDATGHEQKYFRPMVVVSVNRINHGEVIVCVPLTSIKSKHQNQAIPAHNVRIPGGFIIPVSTAPPLPRDSIALCEQVSGCDRSRLAHHWATLTPEALEAVLIGLQHVLGF